MRILSLDLETFGGVDLRKSGVYAYAESLDFEILLLAYAFNDEPVKIVDLANGDSIPDVVQEALTDKGVIKTAFNANFERTCLAKYLNVAMLPEQWRCSQAHALTLGLPASLDGVAKCLKLSQQKMQEGKALIRYFSMPCKPTKANDGRTRNLPKHDPEKWEMFKAYCRQDVDVERSIRKRLENYPMPEQELELWFLDQRINDYGVRVDMELVKNAIQCDEVHQEKLMDEAVNLTGLENPNSVAQLKGWLQDKHGIHVDSLSKAKVEELLKETAETNNSMVKRMLELRQKMSKTSVRKYEAMDRAVCSDGRVRGLLQYHGASTGRFSGRLVQIHNLPRNNMSDLDLARQLLIAGHYEALELLFDSVPDVLSQLIRTAFIPSPGHRLIVSDFSAIERVILAWFAGERWVVDAFNAQKDLYLATASQMFNVPIEEIDKKSPLRQKGKVADLACIAKGQLVLTTTGLVPIEKVTTEHKVWDGEEWIAHEGLVYRGRRETVNADGVICTPEHLILTDKGWVESAKSSGLDWAKVRLPYSVTPNDKQPPRKSTVGMPLRLRLRKDLHLREPCKWKHQIMRLLYAGETNDSRLCNKKCYPENASFLPSLGRYEESMFFKKQPILECIRGSGNYGMQKMVEVRELQGRYVGFLCSGVINRPYRRKWGLFPRQLSLGYSKKEQSEFTQSQAVCYTLGQSVCFGDSGKSGLHKILHKGTNTEGRNRRKIMATSSETKRVYDLVNCGKRHRFAVWNGYRLCLVHNCGYQGSVGALKAMGAVRMGLSKDELKPLVDAWRAANPSIVKLWWDVERAAIKAVRDRTSVEMQHGLTFYYLSGVLFIRLPSGRNLAYIRPRIELDPRFNKYGLTYEGVELGKWKRIKTYSGKLVENIVQAIARDCLAETLLRLDAAGYKIAFHVHDEVILDVPHGFGSLKEVEAIMSEDIDWAPGLPMRADGFEADYYKKD